MRPDDPDADRIPATKDLVAQYLLLYSISGEPDDIDDVVDYDYELANVRGTDPILGNHTISGRRSSSSMEDASLIATLVG